MRVSILFIFLCFISGAYAQNQDNNIIQDLYFYSDAMINAESYANRLRAHQKFSSTFEECLYSKGSWEKNLEEIPFIYGKMSPDSMFKIYTYHIVDQKDITTESGFIQLKSGEVFKLKSTNYLEDIEYNETSYKDWLSGIYYLLHNLLHMKSVK